MLQLKETSKFNAMLDQEGPAQALLYSKWAVHAGKLAACRHPCAYWLAY
jgi:hypothetical protein